MPIAQIFDVIDKLDGPQFFNTHVIVSDSKERELIVKFLNSAPIVLGTSMKDTDFVEPSRGDQVPNIIHSDGVWTWSAATAYYLDLYGLAPTEELYQYIRDVGYDLRTPSEEELMMALDALLKSR